jgi:hypothetical protein
MPSLSSASRGGRRSKLHQTTSCVAADASHQTTSCVADNTSPTEHCTTASDGTERSAGAATNTPVTEHYYARANAGKESDTVAGSERSASAHSSAVSALAPSAPKRRPSAAPAVRELGDAVLLELKLARHTSLRQRMAKRRLGKIQSTLTLTEAYGSRLPVGRFGQVLAVSGVAYVRPRRPAGKARSLTDHLHLFASSIFPLCPHVMVLMQKATLILYTIRRRPPQQIRPLICGRCIRLVTTT